MSDGTGSGEAQTAPIKYSQSPSLDRHSGVVTGSSRSTFAASTDAKKSPNSSDYSRQPHTIGVKLEELKKIINEIQEEFESIDDVRDRAHILTDLLIVVEDLWSDRKQRETEWAQLLNVVNIVLRRIEFEEIKLIGLKGVLEACRILTAGVVDDEDVRSGLTSLTSSGLNPFEVFGEV
ncbi:hypothetical protein OAG71_02515 [bacterium]|nr:hypothetical protein [bacterium]